MTIAIDGIIFSLQRHGGISVYFNELIRTLQEQRVTATVSMSDPALQVPALNGTSVSLAHAPARPLERYRRARTAADAAVFHSSYYRKPSSNRIPSVVTVHDFIYEQASRGLRRSVHMAQKHAAIRAAQALICVSEATRQDLLRWVGLRPGQRVYVVHNGVSDVFRTVATAPAGRPYVLYVGERGGYKNFDLAVRAIAVLPDVELCCVGGGALAPGERAMLQAALPDRFRHAGHVSDEALNELYNRAICLAYPSRYEGFGIPVLEAMRAGCPVVAIACKAVMEIGGDALIVADEEVHEFANAIIGTMDPARRLATIAAGQHVSSAFSWKSTHAQTLKIYDALRA